MSLEASMSHQDWEQMPFRSETLSNGFYSEPDRGLFKGRISRSGDFSKIYRVDQEQFLLPVLNFDCHKLNNFTFS